MEENSRNVEINKINLNIALMINLRMYYKVSMFEFADKIQ